MLQGQTSEITMSGHGQSDDDSNKYANLLQRIQTFVRRFRPTTEEILKEFDKLDCDAAIFRRLLTAAGRDFLPVLFMIGAWGRQYRGGGKLVRFLDAETGTEIKPVVVDEVTGAKIGTRPIRIVEPEGG